MAIFEIIVESVSELWRPRAIIRESVTHMDWRNMSILENNVETTLMYPNLEKRRFSAIAARLSWRVVESDFVMLVIQLNESTCSLALASRFGLSALPFEPWPVLCLLPTAPLWVITRLTALASSWTIQHEMVVYGSSSSMVICRNICPAHHREICPPDAENRCQVLHLLWFSQWLNKTQ